MTRFLLLVVLVTLTACGPQATPFPADVPTTPSAAPKSAASSVRYALAANTQGFVADLAPIQASTQVEQLAEPINPDDLGKRYDIVVSYGVIPEGTPSPNLLHAALVLKMPDSALFDIVRRSPNPNTIVTALNIAGATADSFVTEESLKLRAELANLGWPDGFSLTMAYAYTPGIAELVEQFQVVGIRVQPLLMNKADLQAAFDGNRIQAALITWATAEERATWVERFGSENVIDLYTLPISYQALPELKITFTPDGWPLASR